MATRTTKQLETLSRMHKSLERLHRDLVDQPPRLVTGRKVAAGGKLAVAMQAIQEAMVQLMQNQKFEPIRRSPLP